MSVVVAQDMPQPGDTRYLPALEELLFEVHRAMGGSTLTLFTNRRDMEKVYQGLKPRLAQAGIHLLCQERGSSPKRLRERFLADKSCSMRMASSDHIILDLLHIDALGPLSRLGGDVDTSRSLDPVVRPG